MNQGANVFGSEYGAETFGQGVVADQGAGVAEEIIYEPVYAEPAAKGGFLKFLIPCLLCCCLLLCCLGAIGIALGVGLGVGLSNGSDEVISTIPVLFSSDTSSSSSSTTPSTTSSSTTTKQALTSGPIWNDADCGIAKVSPNLRSARLINGTEVRPNSWPWHVYIKYSYPHTNPNLGNNVVDRCSGVLVNGRTVVTEAYCVDHIRVFNVTKADLLANMRVYVGVHNFSTDLTSANEYEVEDYFWNPSFNGFENANGDNAVIRLKKYVPKSDKVNYICLGDIDPSVATEQLYSTSWGPTDLFNNDRDPAGNSKYILAQVKPVRQQNSVCESSSLFRTNRSNYICVNALYCNGDDGSPLMQQISGHFYLSGLMHTGNCFNYTHYQKATVFFKWITTTIQALGNAVA